MKLSEILGEMTLLVSSYESLKNYTKYFSNLINTGSHVGDIETFNVYGNSELTHYGIFDNGELVAFFNMEANKLNAVWVDLSYRRKGLFSAILLFIKINLGHDKIILGSQHSRDTFNALRRISSRFNMYWEKDGIKEPYDPNTVMNYYGLLGDTGWKIVLENNQNLGKKKFFDPMDLSTYTFALID